MKCPKCEVTLLMMDRSGVEIDYCPNCRGVWLDRGELDKIIDRSTSEQPYESHQTELRPEPRDDARTQGFDNTRRRKKKSFLSDLFDFD